LRTMVSISAKPRIDSAHALFVFQFLIEEGTENVDLLSQAGIGLFQ
jgi:hypothetical protein